jgi:hypothetical protein
VLVANSYNNIYFFSPFYCSKAVTCFSERHHRGTRRRFVLVISYDALVANALEFEEYLFLSTFDCLVFGRFTCSICSSKTYLPIFLLISYDV